MNTIPGDRDRSTNAYRANCKGSFLPGSGQLTSRPAADAEDEEVDMI